MNWRSLDIVERDVVLATGETLHTLASFQGSDGDHDIIKAHIALDGGDLVLVTEFEDASGKRQLGRTTQWPAEIVVSLANIKASQPRMEFGSEHAPLAPDAKIIPPETTLTTETTPESSEPGGSGDPVAPAVEEPAPFDGSQPETTGSDDHGGTEESGNSQPPSIETPTPEPTKGDDKPLDMPF